MPLIVRWMFYKLLLVLTYYGLLFVIYGRGWLDPYIPEEPEEPPPPPEPEPEPIDPGEKIDDDNGTVEEVPPLDTTLIEKYSDLCMLRSCAPVVFTESFFVVFTQEQLNNMKEIMREGMDELMTVTYNKTTRFVVNENFVFRHDMEEVVKKMLVYAHTVAFPPPPPPPSPPETPEGGVGGDEEKEEEIPDPIEEPDDLPPPDPTADKRIVMRLVHNIGSDWNYIVFMIVEGDYDGANPQLLNKDESVAMRYYFPKSYTKVCQSCVPTGWSDNDKCVCK